MSNHLRTMMRAYADTLTVKEVAEICHVSTRTVMNWLGAGLLPGYKLPGSWIVVKDELIEYLEANSSQEDQESP